MADVIPNYSLEIQGIELEKSQLELNIQSQHYSIAQKQDEISRININIVATTTAIEALSSKLLTLKG